MKCMDVAIKYCCAMCLQSDSVESGVGDEGRAEQCVVLRQRVDLPPPYQICSGCYAEKEARSSESETMRKHIIDYSN